MAQVGEWKKRKKQRAKEKKKKGMAKKKECLTGKIIRGSRVS